MNRTLGGWVAWLLVFGLSGCGGESNQDDGNQSETAGESGGQAGDTSASTAGGREEAGADQGGHSNGEGGGAEAGAAGAAAALDPMVYRAMAWDGGSGESERLVVAAWDRSRCQCTWLLFGPQSYFPYDIGSGMWALTEARIGSDRSDCAGQMYSGGGDLADSVSGTVELASDLSQVALDLEIGLAGVTVQTEVSGCVIGSIRDDCRRDNVPVTERTVVVREVCDGVEIELFNTEAFYIGAMMNVLRIGDGCWYETAGRSDGTSLLYLLTDEEFAALEDGVAIESEYGDCGEGTGNGDVYGTLDRASVEKYRALP